MTGNHGLTFRRLTAILVDVKEPLPPSTVKKLLLAMLSGGLLAFSKHAYEEMAKDNLTEVDVRNTLRAGTVRPGELERGTWRYRVETSRMAAVVTSRSGPLRTQSSSRPGDQGSRSPP
jgi:hypothetical protein